MSRILAAFARLLVITALIAPAGQPTSKELTAKSMTLSEAIEFVRPSVVQISARIDQIPNINGPLQVPGRPVTVQLGTGFMVNADGYVITARHVVEALQTVQIAGSKHLMVGIALPNLDQFKSGGATISIRGSFAVTECDVVEEDVRHDVALLKMKQNPFTGGMGMFMRTPGGSIDYPHKVATLSPDRPRDGQRIAVSGYPLSNTVMITTSGNLASSWNSETEEIQMPGAPAGFRIPDTVDSYLADMHVNPGNSGGPVYSVEEGDVIGVCVSFQTAPIVYGNANPGNQPLYFNSGLSNVVPIRYVIDMLKKHSLKWTEITAKALPTQQSK